VEDERSLAARFEVDPPFVEVPNFPLPRRLPVVFPSPAASFFLLVTDAADDDEEEAPVVAVGDGVTVDLFLGLPPRENDGVDFGANSFAPLFRPACACCRADEVLSFLLDARLRTPRCGISELFSFSMTRTLEGG
jgi:hypothetical protein